MKEKYIEMYVDEMKSVKAKWKSYLTTAKANFNKLKTIEENKENRWELKSLEMSYKYFIAQIKNIVSVYSCLIDSAENCELEEDVFKDAMKAVQLINNDLHIEVNKKTFKQLNKKYIESSTITQIV
jgi:hypothetical protein